MWTTRRVNRHIGGIKKKEKSIESKSKAKLSSNEHIETEIARANAEIRAQYSKYANYEQTASLLRANILKYESATQGYNSFELVKMYYLCAYIIINTGDLKKYVLAEHYLGEAIERIENIFSTDESYIRIYAQIYYLYSIIFEHRGDKERAYAICGNAIDSIRKMKLAFLSSDVLKRQQYLLVKDKDLIIRINEESTSTDLLEIFQNRRRLFQMYLQLNDVKNASIILKELQYIVHCTEKSMDKIYLGMYYRDLAKYYFIRKDKEKSLLYFNQALDLFRKYRFDGQHKMLLLENDEYGFDVRDDEGRRT